MILSPEQRAHLDQIESTIARVDAQYAALARNTRRVLIAFVMATASSAYTTVVAWFALLTNADGDADLVLWLMLFVAGVTATFFALHAAQVAFAWWATSRARRTTHDALAGLRRDVMEERET